MARTLVVALLLVAGSVCATDWSLDKDFYHVSIRSLEIIKPIRLDVDNAHHSYRSFASRPAGYCFITAGHDVAALSPGKHQPMERFGHRLIEVGVAPNGNRTGPDSAYVRVLLDLPDSKEFGTLSCYSVYGPVKARQLVETFDGLIRFEFEPASAD